jgi:UDP-N-acetyl-D-galactosamine dehydrogenase
MSELRLITTATPARPKVKHRFEKIAVIGLGYVGFPLSMGLADAFQTVIGFDISKRRVATLRAGHDYTGEIDDVRITDSTLRITGDADDLAEATVYIVTVPTPIDDINRPDFTPLQMASEVIGNYLKRGDLVIFESTVYPGVTEEYCGKILAEVSGLVPMVDFNLGYSPERINPGDKTNTLEKIVKIVSADTPAALDRVTAIYEKVITAGLYRASSIKVAEGAKVLENTQRDVNIALMNELAVICEKVGISTREVIEAASSKWNFVPYFPGLVGGHCIGVDPYYLAALSEKVGHHPEVILAGRRLNDRMAAHIATAALKLLVRRGGDIRAARIGFFGITFKENVPDIRNSKAIDLIGELQSFALNVLVHDPVVIRDEAARGGVKLAPLDQMEDLDMLILTVPHEAYLRDKGFLNRLSPDGILMDVKSVYSRKKLPAGCEYWSL